MAADVQETLRQLLTVPVQAINLESDNPLIKAPLQAVHMYGICAGRTLAPSVESMGAGCIRYQMTGQRECYGCMMTDLIKALGTTSLDQFWLMLENIGKVDTLTSLMKVVPGGIRAWTKVVVPPKAACISPPGMLFVEKLAGS
eukprot:40580-Karenia_brevis.AAC.1